MKVTDELQGYVRFRRLTPSPQFTNYDISYQAATKTITRAFRIDTYPPFHCGKAIPSGTGCWCNAMNSNALASPSTCTCSGKSHSTMLRLKAPDVSHTGTFWLMRQKSLSWTTAKIDVGFDGWCLEYVEM